MITSEAKVSIEEEIETNCLFMIDLIWSFVGNITAERDKHNGPLRSFIAEYDLGQGI